MTSVVTCPLRLFSSWAVVLVFLAVPGIVSGAKRKPEGPRIYLEEKSYDFGKIPTDQGVEHVFVVKNTGSKPLVITRVKTSCGCTAGMMESSVIHPGKTGNLRISYNPKGSQGRVTRYVDILSNDPKEPSVRVSVTASGVNPAREKKEARVVGRTHPEEEKLLFSGDCRACHVPRRGGEKGRKLYMSTCSMCHGESGEGRKIGEARLAPAIRVKSMSVKSSEGIHEVVSAGTGDPWMPGFSGKFGGPLSSEQIGSLVELIEKEFEVK